MPSRMQSASRWTPSGSPSILNASPEAAAGGGLALVETGDRVRIDLNECSADILLSDEALKARRGELDETALIPESQSPWQEIFRERVQPFSEGMVLDGAPKFRDIARKHMPRDNH